MQIYSFATCIMDKKVNQIELEYREVVDLVDTKNDECKSIVDKISDTLTHFCKNELDRKKLKKGYLNVKS
jgi:hypothetical protein